MQKGPRSCQNCIWWESKIVHLFPKTWSPDLCQIANSVLSKDKAPIPSLFDGLEVLSFASDKVKLFVRNFSKNFNLYDSGISLPVFPSRTNLKLDNISITLKIVITNLDSSNASGRDCVPVAVVKNCKPELSYVLAELFIMCLKESCFPDCWKVSLLVPVFKNAGKWSIAKSHHPVNLLSVVNKVVEKLVNNRIVDLLEKCCRFLISNMILGLLYQLQTFWQLCLIELLGLLTDLGILKM